VILWHSEYAVLAAKDQVARMDSHVAAEYRLVQCYDGSVIEQVAHVPAATEQRESQTTDLGAIAGEAVDNSAVATTTHGRFGAKLAPDAAIGAIGHEHLAGIDSVDGGEQQLVFATGIRRVDAWLG
jgi:hypothetical protein